MRHPTCDVCGADEPRLLAERSPRPDVLHRRFVTCGRCGFIYADPRAEAADAERFYAAHDQPSSLVEGPDSDDWRRRVAGRRAHLVAALEAADATVPPDARFLDIGMGDAGSLAAAAELGYEAHGLELDERLVDRARGVMGLEHVHFGDVESVALPEGGFDLVYSWHTIEHVLDVNHWLHRVHDLLRPGGLVMIGTESAEAIQGRLWMAGFRALRRTPWPPTSTDHTYWFSAVTLRALLARSGLETLRSTVYENTPREILDGALPSLRRPRAVAAHGLYLASAAASQLVPRWGGKQVVVARRPVEVHEPAQR